MQSYVLGLMFDEARDHILLSHKRRPAWQRGRLNGIGGKVEDGETFLQAMIRECHEETGISTEGRSLDWQHVVTLTGAEYQLEVFALFSEVIFYALQRTDETLQIFSHRTLPGPGSLAPFLQHWIALALDESDIAKPVTFGGVELPNPDNANPEAVA
jgi:8-oxo-dGTP diphosphatase